MGADQDENKPIQYQAGDIIVTEGEQGGNLLIIKSGVVEVYRERRGTHMTLAQLGKGEILGIMSIMRNQKRAASAKAKTDVVISEISNTAVKKLFADLPRWSNAVISDLMLRVEQADELFTNQYMQNAGHQVKKSYIKIGNQLADGFASFVAIMAKSTENENIVVDDVLTSFSEVVSIDFGKLRKVYDVFDKFQLIDLAKGGSIAAVIDQLKGLKVYAAFIKNTIDTEIIEHLISVFAVSERASIAACLKHLESKGHSMDDPFESTLADLEADLKSNSLEFDPHPFKEAAFYDLLVIDKSSAEHVIKFTPNELRDQMRFIEIAMALDKLEDVENRISKRTLVY